MKARELKTVKDAIARPLAALLMLWASFVALAQGTSKCVVLAALLVVSGEIGLHAQVYSLDWFKVSGGGGSSANGQYELSGTIGQADASAGMSGGSYVVSGGFWSFLAVQMPGAPLLTLFQTTTNTVVISWPAPSTGFVLQQAPALAAPSWADVSASPVVVGGQEEVVLAVTPGAHFFRLKK